MQTPTPQELKTLILSALSDKNYTPMTLELLLQKLNLGPSEIAAKEVILQLILENQITSKEMLLSVSSRKPDIFVTGRISVNAKGFGFVAPSDPTRFPDDIFVPKFAIKNAVDGDLVEVIISGTSKRGMEGEIRTILQRAKTHIGAIICYVPAEGSPLAFAPMLGQERLIAVTLLKGQKCIIGERVILYITDWGSEGRRIAATITDVIGHIDNPKDDIRAAGKEFDLPDEFSQNLIHEAQKFGKFVEAKELVGREDLTGLEIFTIDPATARDFDDAVSLTLDDKGYHLGVHIADVAAYVKPGSPLDNEAKLRGNSTYFPGAVIPMLPEELCNVLCSLRANEIRLTASIFIDFDKEGNVLSHRVSRSYINSRYRFTYESAKELIDGDLPKDHPAQVHLPTMNLMVDLCMILKHKRFERGSIDISMTDTVIMVDEDGQPTHTIEVPYDITHQLIEEFMLQANEMVALHIFKTDSSMVYRVHDEPDPRSLKEFFAFAKLLGFPLPLDPTKADLQNLFIAAKQSPLFEQLASRYIRSMRVAFYSPENVGHFGLMLDHYCHFTSPIRRYCDLVVHRLLFAEISPETDTAPLSVQCSDRERNSMRAEMSVKLLKKLRLLNKWHDKEPNRPYKALVTKLKQFGLFFEVEGLSLEGFIHISDLGSEYFEYDERKSQLTGRSTGKTYAISDLITLKLLSIDLIFLEAKWDFFDAPAKPPRPAKKLDAPPSFRGPGSSRHSGGPSKEGNKKRHKHKHKHKK